MHIVLASKPLSGTDCRLPELATATAVRPRRARLHLGSGLGAGFGAASPREKKATGGRRMARWVCMVVVVLS